MTTIKADEMYAQLDTPEGVSLLPCPCCGSDAKLWQYIANKAAPALKAVMCNNGDAIGPQENAGITNTGCLLYMPTDDFYKPTLREACKYWNAYANALMAMQRKNRWKTASVLRNGTEETP